MDISRRARRGPFETTKTTWDQSPDASGRCAGNVSSVTASSREFGVLSLCPVTREAIFGLFFFAFNRIAQLKRTARYGPRLQIDRAGPGARGSPQRLCASLLLGEQKLPLAASIAISSVHCLGHRMCDRSAI